MIKTFSSVGSKSDCRFHKSMLVSFTSLFSDGVSTGYFNSPKIP